jgi:cobalt/nickel transport system ATP-binding protein
MGFRSRVGFIFQNSDAQVFSPSVREEVAFGPLQLGLGRDEVEARIDDVLAMLEIGELADRAPYQLSGGQKKRVAIASVLVMNPEVILFDEPTAGLDPRTQQWLLELIVELGGAGKTIVLATHDLDLLERVVDRCLVLSEDHRIVAEGAPAEVLADRDTLLRVNLIHEHSHRHGELIHSHPHGPEHHRDPHPGRAGATVPPAGASAIS